MADLHIDDFYHDVATIFLRLYAVFPRKTILYVEDICGPDQPDEFGLHHPRFEAGFSAMVWLAEQGYLNFQETIRAEALDQAVLSRRGFLLLTSRSELDLVKPADPDRLPPSVAEQFQSNISQLRSALRERSSIQLQKCVTYLLSQPPIGGH
jgi:hypothetical protein